MSGGSTASGFMGNKAEQPLGVVLFGGNQELREFLKKVLITKNISVTEEPCRLDVSEETDFSLSEPETKTNIQQLSKSQDHQKILVVIMQIQDAKLQTYEKSTFDQIKAMFGELANTNTILALYSTDETQTIVDVPDDSILKQLVDEGRYFVFHEQSEHDYITGKLSELERKILSNVPRSQSSYQWREERPEEDQSQTVLEDNSNPEERNSKTDAPVQLEEPAKDQSIQEKSSSIILVLLGQSGSGKSSSGNTILGTSAFLSRMSSNPVTTQCQSEEKEILGIPVRVVDTPDFFSEDIEKWDEAFAACRAFCSSGIVVYLLVLQLGRFTEGEGQYLGHLKQVFGEQVTQSIWVLFTHKDELGNTSLKEYIDNTNPRLQELIRSCGSRVYAFDNTNHSSNQFQPLFKQILEMHKDKFDISKVFCDIKLKKNKKDCAII